MTKVIDFLTTQAVEDQWSITIDKVKRAVVILKYYKPFHWDGYSPGTAEATGFIVEGGYILTNEVL